MRSNIARVAAALSGAGCLSHLDRPRFGAQVDRQTGSGHAGKASELGRLQRCLECLLPGASLHRQRFHAWAGERDRADELDRLHRQRCVGPGSGLAFEHRSGWLFEPSCRCRGLGVASAGWRARCGLSFRELSFTSRRGRTVVGACFCRMRIGPSCLACSARWCAAMAGSVTPTC